MAIVVKTIGSGGGRDYSTLAGWAASLPANLVTDGNSYEGDCYNDSEFSGASTLLTLSGHTTDSSHTITLTTGTGQSFRDNAGVQNNALKYNAATGVGINCSGNYTAAISCSDPNVLFSRLQITSSAANGQALDSNGGGGPVTADYCIFEGGRNMATLYLQGTKVRNSLIRHNTLGFGNGPAVKSSGNASSFYFCTVVFPSDLTPGDPAFYPNYDDLTLENVAVFGFTTLFGPRTGTNTITACMTDVASPPAGFTGGKSYASQFVGTTSGSPDYREKAGADLQGAGTADSTNGATDISGTARPQSGKWDIGCWDLRAAGTTVTVDAGTPAELLSLRSVDRTLRLELITVQRAGFSMSLAHLATQRADLRTPLESAATLRPHDSLPVDLGARFLYTTEALDEVTAGLVCRAPISGEWMRATASLMTADAALPIDWSGPLSLLVSLGRLLASPGKRRHLATFGRLRLLKRS